MLLSLLTEMIDCCTGRTANRGMALLSLQSMLNLSMCEPLLDKHLHFLYGGMMC